MGIEGWEVKPTWNIDNLSFIIFFVTMQEEEEEEVERAWVDGEADDTLLLSHLSSPPSTTHTSSIMVINLHFIICLCTLMLLAC